MQKDLIRRFEMSERQGLWLAARNPNETRTLRRRVAAKELVEPYPALFARESFFSSLSETAHAFLTVKTLARKHPTWVFCAFSAAIVHGIDVSHSLLGRVHRAVTLNGHRRASEHLAHHVISHEPATMAEGVRVTSLARTVFDCLRLATFAEGLGIVDSAINRGLIEKNRLCAYALATRGYKNVERARRTISFADGRAENGGESYARAAMIDAGFQMPELQVEVPEPINGLTSSRVDFRWLLPDGREILGELDGTGKYLTDRAGAKRATKDVVKQYSDERLRESRLNLTGATVVRFSFANVKDTDFFVKLLSEAGVPRTPPREIITEPFEGCATCALHGKCEVELLI